MTTIKQSKLHNRNNARDETPKCYRVATIVSCIVVILIINRNFLGNQNTQAAEHYSRKEKQNKTPPSSSQIMFTYPPPPPSSNSSPVVIIPPSLAKSLDAILVLGGGVPSDPTTPPPFAQTRCRAAGDIVTSLLRENDDVEVPAIVCLSAGTAHLPQLLSPDGLPVWESTASAGYILKNYPEIGEKGGRVLVESTSYDTISNAFFARTGFTDVMGWRRLLIVTNEFHMDRTAAIFDWIFNAPSSSTTTTTSHNDGASDYELYYLSCDNDGMSPEALRARRAHEAKGARNVRERLSREYPTLRSVFEFLTTKHDFYAADKLVERGEAGVKEGGEDTGESEALKASYGKTG
mmetsp:Transcript_7949/g.9735  ORF Transcript_7949/g.9735 Transcript_7949/m.9735 type:complete len:349 (-) Transcript_7949:37-1083(-)